MCSLDCHNSFVPTKTISYRMLNICSLSSYKSSMATLLHCSYSHSINFFLPILLFFQAIMYYVSYIVHPKLHTTMGNLIGSDVMQYINILLTQATFTTVHVAMHIPQINFLQCRNPKHVRRSLLTIKPGMLDYSRTIFQWTLPKTMFGLRKS